MTIRELIDEVASAWQNGDALRAAALFCSDAVYREANGKAFEGRDAIHAHFQEFFRGGPAWRFEIEDVVVQDERAVVFYRFELLIHDRWQSTQGCARVERECGLLAQWREYAG